MNDEATNSAKKNVREMQYGGHNATKTNQQWRANQHERACFAESWLQSPEKSPSFFSESIINRSLFYIITYRKRNSNTATTAVASTDPKD